jgi:hypothetical protein
MIRQPNRFNDLTALKDVLRVIMYDRLDNGKVQQANFVQTSMNVLQRQPLPVHPLQWVAITREGTTLAYEMSQNQETYDCIIEVLDEVTQYFQYLNN